APGANLKALSMPRHAAADALESGAADLAVGYFPDLQKAGFFQQRLFRNEHVCIVQRNHPTIGKTITLKQFLAASHAVVRPDDRAPLCERRRLPEAHRVVLDRFPVHEQQIALRRLDTLEHAVTAIALGLRDDAADAARDRRIEGLLLSRADLDVCNFENHAVLYL